MADSELYLNLDELEEAAQIPPKERPSISSQADVICTKASQHGLPSDAIRRILKIVTQHAPLDTSTSRTLLENLYPAELISKPVVYLAVSALGPGARKPVPAVQAQLVRWLILIRDALEDRQAIAHVYAVLFNLIDFLAIRTDLCHLLAVATERRHVKPFRVGMLLNLQAATGQDPALTGLLKVYHSFRPDLVPKEAVLGRASAFEYPDQSWKARLDVLLDGQPDVVSFEDETQFRVLSKTVVRSRASSIPPVHTRAQDDERPILEDVNGLEDFVEKFTRLPLPVKMASSLNDPLMQHYLESLPFEKADRYFEAVDAEVGRALEAQNELLELGEALDKGCIEILTCGLTFAQRFKFLLPSIDSFCKGALAVSQVNAHTTLFAELLAWSNPYYEQDWSKGILSTKTEEDFLASAEHGPITLLSLYTQMIYNRLPTVSTTELDAKTFRSLDTFVDHVSSLALKILATSQMLQAYLAVTAFLQALTDIAILTHTEERQWSLVPFNRRLVYLLAFSSPNVAVLSQLCSALADQKETIFNTAGGAGDKSLKPGIVTTFNGFIMDMSNLLWRSRAFSAQQEMDANAAGCMLSPNAMVVLQEYVTKIPKINPAYSLLNFFSFSFHPALANMVLVPWQELENENIAETRMDVDGEERSDEVRHRGPVTRNSLQRLAHEGGAKVDWLIYRLRVLRWLTECGAPGIDKLMKRTIKALMDGPPRHNLTNSQTDSPRLL